MAKLITMTNKELERYEIIQRLIRKEINGTEAAKKISLSVRQTKRIKAKVLKKGSQGTIHQSRGRESNRKIKKKRIEAIVKIIKAKYPDFGPTFAQEKLKEVHKVTIGVETLRQIMTDKGIWKPKKRKKNKEYRAWRQRKEYYGEMEQFDGSYHGWFEKRGPKCCLLAAVDDASGKITKLKFVHWEGVAQAFIFWRKYIENQGKPVNIYLDRHSTYKQNAKSIFDDKSAVTQFERAMRDLNINVIHAYSPQAKGRVERLFGTLQDRLVKELRLADISNILEANEFLNEVFISKFNQKFAVKPQKKANLHRKLTKKEENMLDQIFSTQEKRIICNDFTIRYKGKWFQLGEIQPTLVLRKEKIQIEERIDGEIFISLRNKYLNYKVLPERPKKIKMKIVALTRTKSLWKPPANHPWRTQFSVLKAGVKQSVSSN